MTSHRDLSATDYNTLLTEKIALQADDAVKISAVYSHFHKNLQAELDDQESDHNTALGYIRVLRDHLAETIRQKVEHHNDEDVVFDLLLQTPEQLLIALSSVIVWLSAEDSYINAGSPSDDDQITDVTARGDVTYAVNGTGGVWKESFKNSNPAFDVTSMSIVDDASGIDMSGDISVITVFETPASMSVGQYATICRLSPGPVYLVIYDTTYDLQNVDTSWTATTLTASTTYLLTYTLNRSGVTETMKIEELGSSANTYSNSAVGSAETDPTIIHLSGATSPTHPFTGSVGGTVILNSIATDDVTVAENYFKDRYGF